jgi:hypothetical protein
MSPGIDTKRVGARTVDRSATEDDHLPAAGQRASGILRVGWREVFRGIVPMAATASIVAAAATGSTGSISPAKLYHALLTTPFPDSQLPYAFGVGQIGRLTPSKNARSHHIVGFEIVVAVLVPVGGPDVGDVGDDIVYGVFPTAADARADINGAVPSAHAHYVPGGVPGYGSPTNRLVAGSTTANVNGKTITYGVTIASVAKGNVVVSTISEVDDRTTSGNLHVALALLRSGLSHLAKVEAGH